LSLYYIVFTLIFYINDLVYMRNRCIGRKWCISFNWCINFPHEWHMWIPCTVNTIITCNYFMVIKRQCSPRPSQGKSKAGERGAKYLGLGVLRGARKSRSNVHIVSHRFMFDLNEIRLLAQYQMWNKRFFDRFSAKTVSQTLFTSRLYQLWDEMRYLPVLNKFIVRPSAGTVHACTPHVPSALTWISSDFLPHWLRLKDKLWCGHQHEGPEGRGPYSICRGLRLPLAGLSGKIVWC
jgi:hypothetical protein